MTAGDTRDAQVGPEDDGSDRLTVRQHLAISVLVAGGSVTAAADRADVDRSTVHRWLQRPTFVAERNRQRALLIDAIGTALLQLAHRATEVLVEEVADDPQVAVSVLRALGVKDLVRAAVTEARFAPTTPEGIEGDQLMERLRTGHLGGLSGLLGMEVADLEG